MGKEVRNFLCWFLLTSSVFLNSCGGSSSSSNSSSSGGSSDNNVPLTPDVNVERTFDNAGNVTYCFQNLYDEPIEEIDVEFDNLGVFNSVYGEGCASKEITLDGNYMDAVVYFSDGESITKEDYFQTPMERDVRSEIEERLKENEDLFQWFEKDVLISVGIGDAFYVDYLIRKNDGKDAIINYVDCVGNLEQELKNADLLDLIGIPNLCMARLPYEELNSQTNDFIDGGFN